MRIEHLLFQDLLAQIASKTPTPGGGAAAAAAAALGASLASMVVAYSLGRKDLAPHEALLQGAHAALAQASRRLLDLAERDMQAYQALSAALKLAKDDPARPAALAAAAHAATLVPIDLTEQCRAMLEVLAPLMGRTNPHLRSDLSIAALLLAAAADAGALTARINLPMLPADQGSALGQQIERTLAPCRALADQVVAAGA